MNINLINYNNPKILLDFISREDIKSYDSLVHYIDEYNTLTDDMELQLHGLVLAKPTDIFVESDNNGTVLEQVKEKEDDLISNIKYYTRIIEQAALLKDYIDDYVRINISDELFDEIKKNINDNIYNIKYKTKEDLVFDMVIHPYRNVSFDKYKNNGNALMPGETAIPQIVEHSLFNLNKHNYNICKELQFKRENNNVKYIIYIKNKKDEYVPYINEDNDFMYDTYEAAEKEAKHSLGVSYVEYSTFNYIQENKNYLFDINNSESFFKYLTMSYNNINVKEKYRLFNVIIYNILNKYYKVDCSKDNILKMLQNKFKEFYYNTNEYDFRLVFNTLINYMTNSINSVINSTKDEYNKMFMDYLKNDLAETNINNKELYLTAMSYDEIVKHINDVLNNNSICQINMFYLYMEAMFEIKMTGKNGVYKIKKIIF